MYCENLRVLYPWLTLQMSQDAKKFVSVNCADDSPAKATDSGVVSPVGNGDGGGDIDFVSKKQRSESSDRCVDEFAILDFSSAGIARLNLPNRSLTD